MLCISSSISLDIRTLNPLLPSKFFSVHLKFEISSGRNFPLEKSSNLHLRLKNTLISNALYILAIECSYSKIRVKIKVMYGYVCMSV